jgi:hypothetical protein
MKMSQLAVVVDVDSTDEAYDNSHETFIQKSTCDDLVGEHMLPVVINSRITEKSDPTSDGILLSSYHTSSR